ncbi:MAG: hypothetical protein ACFE85_09125 [Candidatus Hodarchaeota archaeon]
MSRVPRSRVRRERIEREKYELESKDLAKVITVRIDNELNNNLDILMEKLGLTKADIIRNYLEMSQYVIKQKALLKSPDNRDFIIIKKSYLRKLIENIEEEDQIEWGNKIGRFINDIARINGRLDDIEYKLDICENLGFFPKFIDEDDYLLITNKFGPQKFVEAFIWQIYKQEEFNKDYTTTKIDGTSKIRTQYQKEINPIIRSSSHYSFEFAKIPEEIEG